MKAIINSDDPGVADNEGRYEITKDSQFIKELLLFVRNLVINYIRQENISEEMSLPEALQLIAWCRWQICSAISIRCGRCLRVVPTSRCSSTITIRFHKTSAKKFRRNSLKAFVQQY